jgi:hypothetical protein
LGLETKKDGSYFHFTSLCGHDVVIRTHGEKKNLIYCPTCKIGSNIDKRENKETFAGAILPGYLRRIPSLDNLIPTLYPKGISTGDFTEALSAIPGENAKGLSANRLSGIKKDFVIHTFRHTFATQYLMKGAGINVVQTALGHSDPVTTLKYYAAAVEMSKVREMINDSHFDYIPKTDHQILICMDVMVEVIKTNQKL